MFALLLELRLDFLRDLALQEVIIRPGRQMNQRCQYFKVMDPSTPICLAPCGHFYEEDEYEMHVLEHGSAPFSGLQPDNK